VTAVHHNPGLKRDAASVWIENVTQSSFKVCLRELQNYAGSHEDIHVKWLAFSSLHKPLFSEHNSVYFANTQHPPGDHNNAFCKDVYFTKRYKETPTVIVAANHSSSGGNLKPSHNGITTWVEYINKTGFRVCLKELYETKYDPLSVSYAVLSDICQPGWSYFGGYCYFSSSACASWLTAESSCSTMNSHLVTVQNQEENVYIQHRHNGERSWLSLNDRSVESTFVWTNKEISSFRFWAPKQPNNWNNEDCVHTLGVRHGYTWNDVPCDNCLNFTCFTDLEECSTNTHNCDVNADCVNTVGSYSCKCRAGYTGDGQTCNDLDECSSNSHSCDVNAVCNNTRGSYTCACKLGYSGDGKNCTVGLENSSIVGSNQNFLTWLDKWLKPVTRQSSYWDRCYQATVNGWSSYTFHSNCDGKGPSVTIIRVGKYIFGGYTSLSWTSSSCSWHYNSAAFLFSLVNKPGWQPLKLDQIEWRYSSYGYSIYSCSSYGPTFGCGYDVYIANNAASNIKSYTYLGATYGPPAGNSVGSSFTKSFLAGSYHFRPDEVEVFYETT